jgi:outer membrane lipoprotein SlyB
MLGFCAAPAAFATGVDMNANTKSFLANPLLLVTAIAVILLAVLGIGLAKGWIPDSMTGTSTLSGNASATGSLSSPDQASLQQQAAATTPYNPQQPGQTAAQQQLAQTAPPPAAVPAQPYNAAPSPTDCLNCGTVESVHEYSVHRHPSGVGLVAGALVGGLIGHQFFRGAGNVVSTVGGAAGGAYVGNKVEENHPAGVRYTVRIHLDNGTTHVVRYAALPPFRQGDRVHYDHGHLEAA